MKRGIEQNEEGKKQIKLEEENNSVLASHEYLDESKLKVIKTGLCRVVYEEFFVIFEELLGRKSEKHELDTIEDIACTFTNVNSYRFHNHMDIDDIREIIKGSIKVFLKVDFFTCLSKIDEIRRRVIIRDYIFFVYDSTYRIERFFDILGLEEAIVLFDDIISRNENLEFRNFHDVVLERLNNNINKSPAYKRYVYKKFGIKDLDADLYVELCKPENAGRYNDTKHKKVFGYLYPAGMLMRLDNYCDAEKSRGRYLITMLALEKGNELIDIMDDGRNVLRDIKKADFAPEDGRAYEISMFMQKLLTSHYDVNLRNYIQANEHLGVDVGSLVKLVETTIEQSKGWMKYKDRYSNGLTIINCSDCILIRKDKDDILQWMHVINGSVLSPSALAVPFADSHQGNGRYQKEMRGDRLYVISEDKKQIFVINMITGILELAENNFLLSGFEEVFFRISKEGEIYVLDCKELDLYLLTNLSLTKLCNVTKPSNEKSDDDIEYTFAHDCGGHVFLCGSENTYVYSRETKKVTVHEGVIELVTEINKVYDLIVLSDERVNEPIRKKSFYVSGGGLKLLNIANVQSSGRIFWAGLDSKFVNLLHLLLRDTTGKNLFMELIEKISPVQYMYKSGDLSDRTIKRDEESSIYLFEYTFVDSITKSETKMFFPVSGDDKNVNIKDGLYYERSVGMLTLQGEKVEFEKYVKDGLAYVKAKHLDHHSFVFDTLYY